MKMNSYWTVVTSQIEDGHTRDTYFVTYDDEAINRYANAVHPLMVCISRYSTQKDAWDFVRECLYGYEEIEPLTI